MTFKWKSVRYICASTLLAIALGFVAGYRPFGLGPDFPNYEIFFHALPSTNFLQHSRFEPGFLFFAHLAKYTFHLDLMGFFALLAGASLFLKFYAFKRLDKPWLAIFFYCLVWFPLYENTQMRAAIAVTLLFLAVPKMFEGKWVTFALISGSAVFFHYTAIFAIAFLLLSNLLNSHSKFVWMIAVVGVIVLMFAFFEVIVLYAYAFRSALLDGDNTSVPPNLFSALNIATFTFLVLTMVSGSLTARQSRVFFLMTCFSFSVLLSFHSIPVLANRLREILLVFMTFIAFEYKITGRTLPQAAVAAALAFWSIYSAILYGVFSD